MKINRSERYKRQNKFSLRQITFDSNVRGRAVNNFSPFLLMSTSRKFVKFETADGNTVNSLSLKPRICKLCSPNNACGREKPQINAF